MNIAICFFLNLFSNKLFCLFRSNLIWIDSSRNRNIEIFPFEIWTESSFSTSVWFVFILTKRCIFATLVFNKFYSTINIHRMWIFASRNRNIFFIKFDIWTESSLCHKHFLIFIISKIFGKRK